MRLRGMAAAAAGVIGAATAHALDAAGMLPAVHEAVGVRTAMSSAETVGWLGAAAALGGLAARGGLVRVGAPGALLIAAIPELIGRHDPGAIAEPGAIAGALMQWLLLVAVAAAFAVSRRATPGLLPTTYIQLSWPASPAGAERPHSTVLHRRGRPRAPPAPFLSAPVI